MKIEKATGAAIPLGAIYTKENQIIGEYPDLVPFAQFCKESGLKIIQLLPVNDTGTQSSPYSGLSAFALHPIYIRLNAIPQFEEIYNSDSKFKKDFDGFAKANKYKNRYNYDEILNSKTYFLQKIYEQTEISKSGKPDSELSKFIKENEWLKTYSVYKNLKWKYMQASWKSWSKEDQKADEKKIETLWSDKTQNSNHLFYCWCQLIAAKQFEAAVEEVHKMGLLIKGDMPILMNEDSCDAWAYPQFFNQDLRAGSPADGENPNGQNWGFPTYNWKNLKAENYSWWKNRLKSASKYYDAYRLDHILGFFRIWAIPSGDCNALNGHTEPFASFKREDLYEIGFDDNRIRWLSEPHVPTGVIEDITWNHDSAHKILETLCDRIGNEELWLFKKTVKGSQQIWDTNFGPLCGDDAAYRIKDKLVQYWSNRSLIEVGKNKFVPLWTYGKSTSWASLNESEKQQLLETFDDLNKKNEKLWKKQADEIFTAITSDLNMIPCGEDLGVGIECVPKTMLEHDILGLRVVRWSRKWAENGQPYVPFAEYTPLSVTTTSVHDSSTIREWWNTEQSTYTDSNSQNNNSYSVKDIILKGKNEQSSADTENQESFSPEIAEALLTECAATASYWYINPLQDYLYMNKKYWLEKAEDERINVPGSVNQFNWTYRMPASVEDLLKDKNLIKKINKISNNR